MKMYLKPTVTRIEMRPAETSLSFCKNEPNEDPGWALAGGVCFPGPDSIACKDAIGS